MFDNFSTRARQLVFAARFKAGERGAAVVDTDDFFVGLVLEDQGLLLKTQVERFFVLKMSKNAGRANPDAGNQEAGELA